MSSIEQMPSSSIQEDSLYNEERYNSLSDEAKKIFDEEILPLFDNQKDLSKSDIKHFSNLALNWLSGENVTEVPLDEVPERLRKVIKQEKNIQL